MTEEDLKNVNPNTKVKIIEGYYKGEMGNFQEYNDKWIFIVMESGPIVLFKRGHCSHIEIIKENGIK